MFAVYVNDMTEGMESYMNMFADDAKTLRRIQNEEDQNTLQQDLDKTWRWSQPWETEFNIKKCSVSEMGEGSRRLTKNYKMGNTFISRRMEEKHLGSNIYRELVILKAPQQNNRRSYNLLRNIRVACAVWMRI